MYMKYVQALTVDQFKILLQETLRSLLDGIKKELEESSKEESDLVNIKVVMEKLQVTKPTIYNWIKKGIIKPQKIGGKVLFDLRDILYSIKINGNQFGNGRNYLYKTPVNERTETKEDRRYYRLNWKRMEKKHLTEEEELFFNNYKELK